MPVKLYVQAGIMQEMSHFNGINAGRNNLIFPFVLQNFSHSMYVAADHFLQCFLWCVYYTCSLCYRDSEKDVTAIERIYTDAEIKLVIRKVSSETRYSYVWEVCSFQGLSPTHHIYINVFTDILLYSTAAM